MFKKPFAIALLTLATINSSQVTRAQESGREPIDPNTGMPTGYYANALGAQFELQQFSLPGYSSFRAARIVSSPSYDSPLRQLGLNVGDVIVRLDGTPVHNYRELERHARRTYVRFVRAGSDYIQNGQIYISDRSCPCPSGTVTP